MNQSPIGIFDSGVGGLSVLREIHAALPAESIDDYNSINYMRKSSGAAKSSRLFFYKIFGMPKAVPDERPDERPKGA